MRDEFVEDNHFGDQIVVYSAYFTNVPVSKWIQYRYFIPGTGAQGTPKSCLDQRRSFYVESPSLYYTFDVWGKSPDVCFKYARSSTKFNLTPLYEQSLMKRRIARLPSCSFVYNSSNMEDENESQQLVSGSSGQNRQSIRELTPPYRDN